MYRTEHDDVAGPGGSSLGDLLRDLSSNVSNVARRGIELAAAEVSRKVSKAGKDSQLIMIGAFIAYAGFLFILAAAVIALSLLIPIGWATFSVGFTVLVAGAIAIRTGKKRISEGDLLPNETIDTFKEDTRWMRNQLM
jgi:hypothetical protein